MEKRKIIDKGIKNVFLFLALISTIVIFLIFIFLFKESMGLYGESYLEFGTKCILNDKNPVSKLTARQIYDIYNENIMNWREFDWEDRDIFYIDDYLAEKHDKSVLELVSEKPGAIGVVFKSDLKNAPKNIKVIDVQNISFFSFLIGTTWKPTATPTHLFGIVPLIAGTLWVTISAVLFAIPISIACAVYLSEIAPLKIKSWLKPVIEVLAGIPSVVFGFFGLVVIVPRVKTLFGLNTGETALSSAIMLAIMSLPTIISISEDSINSVPKSLREGSLALGASKWQTIYKVIIPAAKSGIVASIILGIGRAVGETMTVLMISGNAAIIPNSLLQPVRTLTGTIAAELGEAPQQSSHYHALFGIAAVLFIITFTVNLTADLIINRKKL
ncbi:MAG: phosphate ABC transporter permease subunit PstC [Fibrobacterota bacterium]